MPEASHFHSVPRFRRMLLAWFDRNRRQLPWRGDRDPYHVWLSEIMLQQTRVAAVVNHYERFLHRFPTVKTLAAARESAVLAAWSGLGYYRRARMLHAGAKKVVTEYAGALPSDTAHLRELPGIGRYTSAAIASIAFGEPVAVVDGNVERVLRRVYGRNLAGESLWSAAEQLLSREHPGDFNQAMMELGATLCLPRQPRCSQCPITPFCATQGELHDGKSAVRQKKREICYAFAHRDDAVFLVKRPRTSTLMPGMWELPEMPQTNGAVGGHSSREAWLSLRHSITVTDYTVHVFKAAKPRNIRGRWVLASRTPELPLTGLARKILRAAGVI